MHHLFSDELFKRSYMDPRKSKKTLLVKVLTPFVALARFFSAKGKPVPVKILRLILLFPLLSILFLIAVDVNLLGLFGPSPKMGILMDPEVNEATEVYSSEGALLGKFFYENRVSVTYEQLPEELIKTLISTEDERFYTHHGVDLTGLAGVLFDAAKGDARGGSTITQQLVKNMFNTRQKDAQGLVGKLPGMRMVVIKLREWMTAIKLEIRYPKNEILTMYLNTVDFGSNSFGIATASKTYFGIEPKQLSWEQSALLVGMLKATTTYSPIKNPQNSVKRRNLVLKNLAKKGVITPEQADSLSEIPLVLNYSVETPYSGTAKYFRLAMLQSLKPWLKENKLDPYAAGLKIYTTLDTGMQTYAEEAVQQNMKRLQRVFDEHWKGQNPWVDEQEREIPGFLDMTIRQSGYYKDLVKQFKGDDTKAWAEMHRPRKTKLFSWEKGTIDTVLSFYDETAYYKRFLHTGMVSLDPENGAVRAYVGDINFDFFKYDNVSQSQRQPGSTFKPFLYLAAMENGWHPCDEVVNQPVTIRYRENGKEKTWSPRNADWSTTGASHTLKNAMALSLNTITVQVAQKIGFRKVNEYAEKMGITSPLDTFPSLCLGSSDVSLIELVRSYCPFVNGGYRIDPHFVTKITDSKGKVLYEVAPKKQKVVTDKGLYYMTHMFRGTLSEPYGTTQALFVYDIFKKNIEFGGKTGTSSNHSDGWFVGITPKMVTGSWVGGSERAIRFKSSSLGEGCKTALPNVGLFFEKVVNDHRYDSLHAKFTLPEIDSAKCYMCHTPFVARFDSLSLDSAAGLVDSVDAEGNIIMREPSTTENSSGTDQVASELIDELF